MLFFAEQYTFNKAFFSIYMYISFLIHLQYLEIKNGNKMKTLKYYKTYYICNPSIPLKSIKSPKSNRYIAMLERYFSQILLEFGETSWNLYFSTPAKLVSHFIFIRNIHVKHSFLKDPLESNHTLLMFLYEVCVDLQVHLKPDEDRKSLSKWIHFNSVPFTAKICFFVTMWLLFTVADENLKVAVVV